MFKPEKNLKLSLNRHDFFFFPRLLSVRFVSQTFANDVPHGYASFKHICNVIIGYVNGMNKSMLDLYKKLESQRKREKRKNGLKMNFLSFPSLFFLFFPLSLSCQYSSSLHKRRGGGRFLVYVFSPKQSTFLLYFNDFTRSYITQIFEYFCQGQIACNGQLYFQLL